MALTPDFESFARAYDAGENQIVYTRLAADLDTPVSLMLKLTGAQKDAFVLESVTGGEVRGRYSIIGMKPDLVWRCQGDTSSINRTARFDSDAFVPQDGNPLDVLRTLIGECKIDLPDDLPQSAAGLFGYLGYDMIRLVEHLPNVNPDPLGLPDAIMLRPSVIAVLDGVKGEVTVVSPAWVSDGQTARAAYAQAAERVMDAVRDLERTMPTETRNLGEATEANEPVSNFTREGTSLPLKKPKTTFVQATSFKLSHPNVGPRISRKSRSLCTVPCAVQTHRLSCSISTLVVSKLSAQALKFWSVCLVTKSQFVRSPEHANVGRHQKRIAH